MNKKLVAVLTALMMLSTSTIFLAAGSPSTDVTTDDSTVQIVTVDATVEAAAEEAAAEELGETAEVLAVVDVEGKPGVPITVKIAGVTANDTVKVLHEKTDGVWEVLDATTGDGTVTFTSDSFSIFAFVKVAAETPNMYYWLASPYGSASAATLPKTGVVAVLPVAAMACLAGAVACGRKEK